MDKDTTYAQYSLGSEELVAKLVDDHQGWAAAIARSVARAWNLDWQLDGLDGGAYEALLFCARRFDPLAGVPFKAYARRRIHESCTTEARSSKTWQQGTSGLSDTEQDAREISFRIFEIFPELREGMIPTAMEGTEDSLRATIKQLLSSASIISTFQQAASNPENQVEFKRVLNVMSELDIIHQHIIWELYWQGSSMRAVASTWGIDELVIMREHQAILEYVTDRINSPKTKAKEKLKIRPKLRGLAEKLGFKLDESPFGKASETAVAVANTIVLVGTITNIAVVLSHLA